MAPLFRRNSSIQCFFCHSPVLNVRNPTNFRCQACGCWNRYSDKGEIISDEPAMHQEDLNRVNFSKRASFSKDQLPNLHRNGPFCHNCQTNQMLIMNLLSNYLPPPENPEYQQRVRMYPKYKESLYARYPPVCETCKPAVEEEIQNKEQMARRKALNGWLQGGKERQRKVSGTPGAKEKSLTKTLHWRIRGCLWFTSSIVSMTSLLFEFLDRSTIPSLVVYTLPFWILVSLLWTAWDPTYIVLHKAQLQNRDVRLNGKRNYVLCQMSAWFLRLVISIVLILKKTRPHVVPNILTHHHHFFIPIVLLVELLALVASPIFLHIHHPPPIRLIDTHAHLLNGVSRSATPATTSSQSSTPVTSTFPKLSEQDLLATLSLSSTPVMTPPPNPVFGHSSFGPSPSTTYHIEPKIEDEDAMDWSPINGDVRSSNHQTREEVDSNSSWLRPQRFFAPEKPTGLENLFARTRLDDSDLMQIDQEPSAFALTSSWRRRWYIPALMAISVMVSAFVAFSVVKQREAPTKHIVISSLDTSSVDTSDSSSILFDLVQPLTDEL